MSLSKLAHISKEKERNEEKEEKKRIGRRS
jgi:hypothetical protein